MAATWGECPACSSAMLPMSSRSSSASNAAFSCFCSARTLLGNALDGRRKRRLMPMAMSR
ncbi:hypothetical protein BDW72DRAFT_188596 [Aspergillus terricola var. indicus]